MPRQKQFAGFTLLELMIVVAILAILAGIAIQQYQAFTIRSQVNRVMGETSQIRTAVETCLYDNRLAIGVGLGQCNPGATGSSLQAAGGNASPGAALPADTGVPLVTDPLTLSAQITATWGNGAHPRLAGESLSWERSIDGAWRCTTTADPRWRPEGCQ